MTSDLASAYSPEKTPASTGKAKQPEAIPVRSLLLSSVQRIMTNPTTLQNQPLTCISPAKTLYIPDAPSTNTVTEDDATVIAPVDAASSRTTVSFTGPIGSNPMLTRSNCLRDSADLHGWRIKGPKLLQRPPRTRMLRPPPCAVTTGGATPHGLPTLPP